MLVRLRKLGALAVQVLKVESVFVRLEYSLRNADPYFRLQEGPQHGELVIVDNVRRNRLRGQHVDHGGALVGLRKVDLQHLVLL